MLYSIATESSCIRQEADCQWLVWCYKDNIAGSMQSQQDVAEHLCDNDISQNEQACTPGMPVRQNQYAAILNRFEQAAKTAGSFSSWST